MPRWFRPADEAVVETPLARRSAPDRPPWHQMLKVVQVKVLAAHGAMTKSVCW